MAWPGDDDLRNDELRDRHPTGIRAGPLILTVVFTIIFIGIADLAWMTAKNTSAPWFSPAISGQVYASTLTTAVLGALVIAALAVNRLSAIESKARPSTVRDNRVPAGSFSVSVRPEVELTPDRPISSDGIDRVIAELAKFTDAPRVTARQTPASELVQLLAQAPLQRAARSGRPSPRSAQPGLRKARNTIWLTLAGPLAMFLVFVSIGGAMLPGSGEFALANFQLNTALILFLGYGWPFLVAWAIGALVLLHAPIRPEAIPSSSNGGRADSW